RTPGAGTAHTSQTACVSTRSGSTRASASASTSYTLPCSAIACRTARSISPLVSPDGSNRGPLTRGRSSASAGWSHSCEIATSRSSSPSAHAISVPLASSDAIRVFILVGTKLPALRALASTPSLVARPVVHRHAASVSPAPRPHGECRLAPPMAIGRGSTARGPVRDPSLATAIPRCGRAAHAHAPSAPPRCRGRLHLRSDQLLELAQQRVAAGKAGTEQAVVALVRGLRRAVQVEPEVEPLAETQHRVEPLRRLPPEEDEIDRGRDDRDLEQDHVLERVQQQLQLEDQDVPDQDAGRR